MNIFRYIDKQALKKIKFVGALICLISVVGCTSVRKDIVQKNLEGEKKVFKHLLITDDEANEMWDVVVKNHFKFYEKDMVARGTDIQQLQIEISNYRQEVKKAVHEIQAEGLHKPKEDEKEGCVVYPFWYSSPERAYALARVSPDIVKDLLHHKWIVELQQKAAADIETGALWDSSAKGRGYRLR